MSSQSTFTKSDQFPKLKAVNQYLDKLAVEISDRDGLISDEDVKRA
jgi:hypothetical protein